MKRMLVALTVGMLAALPLQAQDVSKILADASTKANTLAWVTYNASNELTNRQGSGQALCVDDSGLFVSYAFEVWMKSDSVQDVKLTLPGNDEKSYKAQLLWVDQETGLAFIRATEKFPWAAAKFNVNASLAVGSVVSSVGLVEADPAHTVCVSAAYAAAVLRVPDPVVMVSSGKLTGLGSPVMDASGAYIGIVGTPQPFAQYDALIPQQGSTNLYLRSHQEATVFRPARTFIHVINYAVQNPDRPRQMPWLGVASMMGISKDNPLTAGLKLDTPAVMFDQVIPGQNGEKAGLKNRDVVVALNGKPLEKLASPDLVARNFERQLMTIGVGQSVELTIRRDSQNVNVTVPLEAMPMRPSEAPLFINARLGLMAREKVMLDKYLLKSPSAGVPGVLVVDVQSRSACDMAGLRRDDLITAINDQPVDSLTGFRTMVDKALTDNPNRTINFVIKRGDQTLNISVQPPAAAAPAK